MSEAAFLPMKAGYRDLKSLNENLRPLERYLSRQVNRPWDMVYREMCAVIDGRNAVQRHILEHLRQYVAIRTSVVDGELIDLGNRFFGPGPIWQSLYVHPGPDCCAGTQRMCRGAGAIVNGSKSLNVSVPIAGANSPPVANCTGSMGNGSSWRSQLCRRPLRSVWDVVRRRHITQGPSKTRPRDGRKICAAALRSVRRLRRLEASAGVTRDARLWASRLRIVDPA
jgi:hypothetical protein